MYGMISFNVLTIEDPEFTAKAQCGKRSYGQKLNFQTCFCMIMRHPSGLCVFVEGS